MRGRRLFQVNIHPIPSNSWDCIRIKRSDWWRLKRLVSVSVASVFEICESGAWALHTLLDDRDVLLSGGHLWQSVCEQYREVCGRRTLSAVGVSLDGRNREIKIVQAGVAWCAKVCLAYCTSGQARTSTPTPPPSAPRREHQPEHCPEHVLRFMCGRLFRQIRFW